MDSSRPQLRPLGVGEMVDGAIRLYRNNFGTLLKISAMVLGPIALLQLIGTLAVGPVDLAPVLEADPATADLGDLFAPLVPAYTVLAVTGILSFFGTVLVQGASITALGQYYQGQVPDAAGSLRAGLTRFFPLLIATILVALGSTIGLIFCLVPGVLLFTYWAITPPALVTERLDAVEAMSRSWQLVKGRFWPVLGAIVLSYLLYWIASQIVGFITGFITVAGISEGSFSVLPGVIGSAIVQILAAPFLAAMLTIVYFDTRVRKEGYDLELMAHEIARLEQGGAPPPRSDTDDPFGLGSPGADS